MPTISFARGTGGSVTVSHSLIDSGYPFTLFQIDQIKQVNTLYVLVQSYPTANRRFRVYTTDAITFEGVPYVPASITALQIWLRDTVFPNPDGGTGTPTTDAGDLTSGILPDARLSDNIARGAINSGSQSNLLAYYISSGRTLAPLSPITGSRALVSTAGGLPTHSNFTTALEIGHVAGVTSPIQTQLDGKASTADIGPTQIIDVGARYTIVSNGSTDNVIGLMAMREALAVPNQPHYHLYMPAPSGGDGSIRSSDNRYLYGIDRFTIHGNYSTFRTIYAGSDWAFQRPFYSGHLFENNVLDYAGVVDFADTHLINTVEAGSKTIVSPTGVDDPDCVVGARIWIYGFVRDTGYPPLATAHEIGEIESINTGTDTITLKRPIKNRYLSTWFDMNPSSITGQRIGKPRILFVDRTLGKYPKYAEFRDLTFGANTGNGDNHAAIYPAEILKIINCEIEGYFWPSECQTIHIEDSNVQRLAEFDRLVDILICKRVKFNGEVNGAAGINNVYMEDCECAHSVSIAPRNMELVSMDLRVDDIPSGFAGALDSHPGRYPSNNKTINRLRITAGPNFLGDKP